VMAARLPLPAMGAPGTTRGVGVGWGAGGNDVPHGTVLRRQRQMAQGAPAAVAGPLGVLPTTVHTIWMPALKRDSELARYNAI
jgi:hypothetical protein